MLNDQQFQAVIEFLQKLVQTNSLSGQEGALAKLVEEQMRLLNYDQVMTDEVGNVIGIRKGRLPGPVVLFDSHMDVVEVQEPESWRYPPFSAEIHNDRLYGRGAQDMKGPLAAVVTTLGLIPAEEIYGTLVVSASVHEEKHEGFAIQKVIEAHKPDFVVICEPNGAKLGIGQKGRAGITLEVFGKPAHSSVPHLGENAVIKALPLLEKINQMPVRSDPILGDAIMVLIDAISTPHPSRSTLPASFFMHYDRRLIRNETPENVLHAIEQELGNTADYALEYQTIELPCYTGKVFHKLDFHPAWVLDETSPWMEKAANGLKAGSIKPEKACVLFCTNGSYSAGTAKIPTMIFGPSDGMLAHCRDESISLDELRIGCNGYWGLATTLGR